MHLSTARRLAASFVLIALLAACSPGEDSDSSPSANNPTVVATSTVIPDDVARETLAITTTDGSRIDVFAELAITPEERSQGLMGRTELEPDSGMLFVIPPPGRGFWMKDTPVALTIAFIATCGEIVDLIDMEPLSQEVKNASQPYGFALEMEQGWFSDNGVAVGDVVEIPPDLVPEEC
jgi:uncharacterized membrane protein (UPF0127 family)